MLLNYYFRKFILVIFNFKFLNLRIAKILSYLEDPNHRSANPTVTEYMFRSVNNHVAAHNSVNSHNVNKVQMVSHEAIISCNLLYLSV